MKAIARSSFIAASGLKNSRLHQHFTQFLTQVIRESAELALSWVKTHAYDLGFTTSPFQDPLKGPNPIDIHLHLPAGAIKKDGPSAGVAMVRFS